MNSREWTVLVDTREKKPLVFPSYMPLASATKRSSALSVKLDTVRIHTNKVRLPTGDYTLAGHQEITLIERKGSLRELIGCCLTRQGLRRFESQLSRLVEATKYPTLLLEGRINQTAENNAAELAALDMFIRIVRRYPTVQLLIVPTATFIQRRRLGEFVCRYLINTVLGEKGSPSNADH